MNPPPLPQDWEDALSASSSLRADAAILKHVDERFRRKYLRAALIAQTPAAETRAWDAFFHWLTAPATTRKPFEVPTAEAVEILARLRLLAERLKSTLPSQP